MSDSDVAEAKTRWLRASDEAKEATEAFTASLLHVEGETIEEHDRKIRALVELGKKLKRARMDQEAALGAYIDALEVRQRSRLAD